MRMRLPRLCLALLSAGCIAGVPATAVAAPAVLRVGVVDGAQPCSDAMQGQWRGLAVDLWGRVAAIEQLPFIYERRPTAADLLEAVQRGELDVGVGCLTITPERVNRLRFSLPFQEMGLAVLQRRTRLEAGGAVLRSLLSRDLLQLLAVYLLCIAVVSGLLWRCEAHGSGAEQQQHGRRRGFAKVFQILATGPGTNTIASTTRGHGLVIVSYLVRIVTASMLVTTITVRLVREPATGPADPSRLADLQGLRVAARPGSVSEEVLRALRAQATTRPLQIIPLQQVSQAAELLLSGRADAVLAEDLQVLYAQALRPREGLVISLQGLQRESQAFALSPRLSNGTVARINRAISTLKRQGVVHELQDSAMNNS